MHENLRSKTLYDHGTDEQNLSINLCHI